MTPRRSVFLAAIFGLFFAHGLAAGSAEIPYVAHLAAGESGTIWLGTQLLPEAGSDEQYEIFRVAPDGSVRKHGRYNGILAGMASEPGKGILWILTRDGVLLKHGEETKPVVYGDSRWNMRFLAWHDGAPTALNHDGQRFTLARPGTSANWIEDAEPVALAEAPGKACLVEADGRLHLLWTNPSPDLSGGMIRFRSLVDGRWRENPPLAIGDVAAFSVCPRPGREGLEVLATVPDILGRPTRPKLVLSSWRNGAWHGESPPAGSLADAIASALDFASLPPDVGGPAYLTVGMAGARLHIAGGSGALNSVPVIPPPGGGWRVWPLLTIAALLLTLALAATMTARRSRRLSLSLPGVPPDLASRGVALLIDAALVALAVGAFHLSSGDMNVYRDGITLEMLDHAFWLNLAALVAYTVVFETATGTTPGKRLMGLRVRSLSGGPPRFTQVCIRNLFRAVDMYPVIFPGLIGAVFAGFNPKRQRLGDVLAGTVVRRHAPALCRRLLLASSSPRRRELLRALDADFSIAAPGIDEDAIKAETPAETARRVALAKAEAAIKKHAHGREVVVAADTVVVVDGIAWGKPRDADDAKVMLSILSGRSHQVMTGVAVWDSFTGQILSDVETTEVEFRQLSAAEIDAYASDPSCLDKAGAYGAQDGKVIRQIRGSVSNVIGLPMELLLSLLEHLDA